MDELESMIDYGQFDTYSAFKFNNGSWSATLVNGSSAWVFALRNDNVMAQFLQLASIGDTITAIEDMKNVRCVRGQQKLKSFNKSSSGGVVVDNSTGLAWQNSSGALAMNLSFSDAVDYCNNLSIDGYGNWRLPNIRELRSIYDYSSLSFYPIFTIGENETYWTSTPLADQNDSTKYITYILSGSNMSGMPFSVTGTDYNLDGDYDHFEINSSTLHSELQLNSEVFLSAFSTRTLGELTIFDTASLEYPSVMCVREY